MRGQRFPAMNLAEDIFRRSDPGAPALLGKGECITYGDLDRRSAEIASWLRGVTRSRCARIGLRCADGPEHVLLALAILRAGQCLVPLAPELTDAEHAAIISTLSLEGVVKAGKDGDGELTDCGGVQFCWQRTGCTDAVMDRNMAGTDSAFIRFSSGTTGEAKGILLSHRMLRDRIEAANAGLGIKPGDRVLWILSMSHHFAVSILLYLWNGAAIVIPESHLPGDLLSAAEHHGATVFYAAPCHYLMLVSGSRGERLSRWPSLRLAVSTTSALSPEAAKKFAGMFGIHPAQALGLMEVGLPLLNLPDPALRPSSVGCVQEGFEARILDRASNPCGPDEAGELLLRGPGMFDAYVAPWKPREEALEEGGWFRTGDIATRDSDGFVTLVSRTKNVISVGGLKFFPEEVEEVLCSLPEIREARVFAAAHPSLGSVPVAEVVAEPGAATDLGKVSKACRARLARYKVPVEFRSVDSIPKTPSGKIRRTSP